MTIPPAVLAAYRARGYSQAQIEAAIAAKERKARATPPPAIAAPVQAKAPPPPPPPPPPLPPPVSPASAPQPPSPLRARTHFSKAPDILREVASYYNLTLDDLISRTRHRRLSRYRHIAMYLAYRMTTASFPQIAKLLFRDHTTIMHGVDRIEMAIRTDERVAEEVEAIRLSIWHKRGIK